MLPSELYLPAARYHSLISDLVSILRTGRRYLWNPAPTIDAILLRARIASALQFAGIDPDARPALIEALMACDPDPFSGDFDQSGVATVLGECGNVWPETIRTEAA